MRRTSTPPLERYGRTAVITGASDGIGREIAIALAQRGFDLVLVARRLVALDALAAELKATYGVTCTTYCIDLRAPGAGAHLVSATRGRDVGVLVAAAGYGSAGLFVDHELRNELAMVDVNCRAVVELSHAFGKHFAEQKRGGIVLFGSLVGWQGTPFSAVYAATKAFVQTFAEGLQRELSSSGVSVLACAPGPVRSGFAKRAKMRMGFGDSAASVAQTIVRALGRNRTIVPGFVGKLLTLSLFPLPRWARVRIMERIMYGMAMRQTP